MKYLIKIVFLFVATTGFSQEILEYNYKYSYNWKQEGFQTIGEKSFQTIFPTIQHLPWHDLETAFENIDKYHLIDIDNDNVDEIIYNGYSGSEGEMVLILKQIDNKYSIIQTFFGRIVNIEKENDFQNLTVLDYSCCGGYVDHIQFFKYDADLNNYIIGRDLAKLEIMADDASYVKPIKFEVVRDQYNLRFNPKIVPNLNSANYDFDLIQNQNISAIYSKGATGTAIAENIDETGRIWWLVIMNDNYLIQSIFYEGNNECYSYQLIGWMSSKYLKRQ